MVATSLAVLIAVMGAVALPATADASTLSGPTVTGGGTVPNNSGFSWQTVFFPAMDNPDGVDEIAVYVWDNTGTFNTGAADKMAEWMSVNGGAWYEFTNRSDGVGGYYTTFGDPSALPGFLNPDVDSEGYALFTGAVVGTLSPPTMPVFPPPTTDPPVLDSNPDQAAPPDAPIPPDSSLGATADPGGDPMDSADLGGGSSDPGSCGGSDIGLEC